MDYDDMESLGRILSATCESQIKDFRVIRTGARIVVDVTTDGDDRVGFVVPNESRLAGILRIEREISVAQILHAAGAPTPRPIAVRRHDDFTVMWMEKAIDVGEKLTAKDWQKLLVPIWESEQLVDAPVFSNLDKTMDRLGRTIAARPDDAEELMVLKETYYADMNALFDVATRFSPVHGDAHSGNAMMTATGPIIYDFETYSIAPTVWDITHLLNRAGTDGNELLTRRDILEEFGFMEFSLEEIEIALNLRRTAAAIASKHQELRTK